MEIEIRGFETEENKSGHYILCDDCKNYQSCLSFWRGSVNSLNCSIEYGLFESKQKEAEHE